MTDDPESAWARFTDWQARVLALRLIRGCVMHDQGDSTELDAVADEITAALCGPTRVMAQLAELARDYLCSDGLVRGTNLTAMQFLDNEIDVINTLWKSEG